MTRQRRTTILLSREGLGRLLLRGSVATCRIRQKLLGVRCVSRHASLAADSSTSPALFCWRYLGVSVASTAVNSGGGWEV